MLFFFGRTRYTILNESDERGCDAWIDRTAEYLELWVEELPSKLMVNEKYKDTDWSISKEYRERKRETSERTTWL